MPQNVAFVSGMTHAIRGRFFFQCPSASRRFEARAKRVSRDHVVMPAGVNGSDSRGGGGMPLLLLASTAIIAAIVGAALSRGSYLFAAYLVLAAVFPVSRGERKRALGVVLAWAGVAGCIVAVARVPLGARVTVVYLPALVALLARIAVLRAESVMRWAVSPRG
jgi:hypothetical protein